MKFYYNDKLIRTSKNHEYTHAVIDANTGVCKGCRTNYQACASIISSEINSEINSIKDDEEMLKAIRTGKNYYTVKFGRHTFREKIRPDHTVERITGWINGHKEKIEYINKNWKIVELERRG